MEIENCICSCKKHAFYDNMHIDTGFSHSAVRLPEPTYQIVPVHHLKEFGEEFRVRVNLTTKGSSGSSTMLYHSLDITKLSRPLWMVNLKKPGSGPLHSECLLSAPRFAHGSLYKTIQNHPFKASNGYSIAQKKGYENPGKMIHCGPWHARKPTNMAIMLFSIARIT